MRKKKKNKGKTFDDPLTEQMTREKILNQARGMGCEQDILQIFAKIDNWLKHENDPVARKQIGILGASMVHKALNYQNALVVDGQEIIPADPDYKEEV